MRKALALSLIVTVLGVAAYFFKPSEEDCIEKAKLEFRSKIAYTINATPKQIDKNIFGLALEKIFLQELEVKDRFFYRDIYQNKAKAKNKIGWGAFGWISVNIK